VLIGVHAIESKKFIGFAEPHHALYSQGRAADDQHMQTSLRGIAKRAKEDPKHRFGNLYSLLNKANWNGFNELLK
jgi:hypothetical protein